MDFSNFEFSLTHISWEAISALSGLAIAGVGYAINRRLRKQEELTNRYTLLTEYRREVIDFSQQFFETVSEAMALRGSVDEASPAPEDLDRISTKLSSLVDLGRFIFPNYVDGDNSYGWEKGAAFAGTRRPPLDAILAAFYAVEAMRRSACAVNVYLQKSLEELEKTKQPLTSPVRENDPVYLLVQSRRCYLNAVVPDTFPKEWRLMFSKLLGPVNS